MATYASLKYDFGTQITGAIPTAAIADDAITLAKMAGGTDGNLIGFDASGDPAAIATGTAGQVLTSGGADAASAMADAAGGGKILQVSHRVTNSTAAGTHTSLAATDVYAAITPSATSSTILVMMTFAFNLARGGASPNINGATAGYAVYRDIGGAGYNIILPAIDTVSYNLWGYTRDYATLPTIYLQQTPNLIFMDSPNTTSACTYKLYYQAYGGSTAYYGKGQNVDHTTLLEMDGS